MGIGWRYKHIDGKGKVVVGGTREQIETKSFCASVFGELDRTLEKTEFINSSTGMIESLPQSQHEKDNIELKRINDLSTKDPTDYNKALDILIKRNVTE